MKKAEIVMTLMMAAFSAYLMWKSAELSVGWVEDEGPGGGAWPFWLSAIMFGTSVWSLIRCVRGASLPSQSDEPFMDDFALRSFLQVAVPLGIALALIHVVGIYFSIPLFMIYYMRFLGKHKWPLTLAVSISTPVVTFFFFDIALRIVLPKGYTEPMFYPLYDIFL
ncbi:MAG: tripartite tricarboxylate transporter TctB family protein [Rhodospirillales bacterium]|jgi:putative tricarboxylic transport membrane protein|nr:tripartite tricarboxylate transporter TctB family protein [Rhodospirillales bacterium]MBT4039995.1 tripartite tricarboxylate transporter TctB family protein [Rhodospirillales bacterium]MBT4625835.1 tripartite tricarboxylate transporter TctB family protein [Rhodospirillales bacterium]MBT5351657.1 tripartite tricarboxylate transporter TctB family protein [Rhodospirillales bacterium]MBT5521334.1 tripartite tricarboxylate transporter TctB family protein [Rhodospirillales bacterium]